MLLLIDNYDSFTYNLVHYFQCLQQKVAVFQHDELSIEDIEQLNPQYIVLSPGPKSPSEAGICLPLIAHFYQRIPILGICLGHQCIGQAFGASIITAPHIIHGKTSLISHHQKNLFAGIARNFQGMRYHSLVVDPNTLPSQFCVDAWADDLIMAISHRQFPLFGLQFHPESILSEFGLNLLKNFLSYEYTQNT